MTRIAETAAGVAAGAVVAEGVESMLHSFGHEHQHERDFSPAHAEEHRGDEAVDSSFYNPHQDASRDLSPSDSGASNFVDESSAGDWQDVGADNDDPSSFDDGGSDSGSDDNS